MFEQVIPLLFERVLHERLIHISNCADDRQTVFERIGGVERLLAEVQLVGRDPDNEIIPQRSRALENVEVPEMKEIECTEGDDASHERIVRRWDSAILLKFRFKREHQF